MAFSSLNGVVAVELVRRGGLLTAKNTAGAGILDPQLPDLPPDADETRKLIRRKLLGACCRFEHRPSFFCGGGALAGWIFSGPTAPQSTQTRTDSTVSPAVARSHTRCRWPPASTGDAANRAKVLEDVVLTLETSRSNDLVRLRELYGKLTEYYQGNGRRGAAMEGSESSDERDLYGLRRCHRLRSVAAAVPRTGGGPADATFLGRFIAATYVRCLCALAASSKSTARSPQPSTSASTTCRRSTGTGSTSAYIRLSRGRGRAHGQGDGADEEGGSGCFARR